MDKNKIIKELGLRMIGSKGWYNNKNLLCPKCGKNGGKFNILFTGTGGAIVNCFKCKYKSSIYELLQSIDRLDLYSKESTVEIKNRLDTPFIKIKDKDEIKTIPSIKKPLGYIPIKTKDVYLNGRKFMKEHYDLFKPGYSGIAPKITKDHIIFLIYQNHELVSWLARSKRSKEWHKNNLEKYKEDKESLVLRYYNYTGTSLSHMLGGYDEITPLTDTLILVEGLFDKTSVDYEWQLYKQDKVKCCFTFGDSLSIEQVDLIKQTNIKNVILFYDYNTIKESKSASMKLLDNGLMVKVAEIKNDTDPGEMILEEMSEIFSDLKDSLYFYANKV